MTQTPTSTAPHVAVVGGGILGVSIAAHLIARGARVTLLTKEGFADGASGRSLAWLNSWGDRSEAYHQLRLAGIDRYRTLLTRFPAAASYLRFDGGLTWPAAGATTHDEAAAAMRSRAYDARRVTPAEVSAQVPGVDARAIGEQGAIFSPGEGWVDLPQLITHLLGQVREGGGTIVEGAGVVEPIVEDGRTLGVLVAGERLEADHVVLALGAGVPAALADLGTVLPDATPVALLVRTPPMDTPLRAVLNTPRVAVRPTPDGALVMDSAWSEEEIRIDADGNPEVAPEIVTALLKEASAVLDGNPTLEAESLAMGPKPIPGDGEPVLGPVEGIAGLHVAFTHSGATLGLIAGELIADEIVTGTPHPMLATFRPARFA